MVVEQSAVGQVEAASEVDAASEAAQAVVEVEGAEVVGKRRLLKQLTKFQCGRRGRD